MLCDHIRIAEVTTSSVKKCLKDPKINDFEDGLEYYAAVEANAIALLRGYRRFFTFKDEVLNCQTLYETSDGLSLFLLISDQNAF